MITSKGLVQLGFDKDADFVLQEDGNGTYISEWLSSSARPTTADIEAAHVVWKTEYDSQEYARKRKTEYPSIGDQLDMLWHAVDTGDWTAAKVKTTEFYTALKAVKDAHPKP